MGNALADFNEKKEEAPRWQTAQAVENMLDAVRTAAPAALVEAMASLTPQTSEAAMGTGLTSSADVVAALAAVQWKLFESIQALGDDRAAAAQALLGRVKDALSSDQHVKPLSPVLKAEQSKAIDLLTPPPTPVREDDRTPSDVVRHPAEVPQPQPDKKVVESDTAMDLSLRLSPLS